MNVHRAERFTHEYLYTAADVQFKADPLGALVLLQHAAEMELGLLDLKRCVFLLPVNLVPYFDAAVSEQLGGEPGFNTLAGRGRVFNGIPIQGVYDKPPPPMLKVTLKRELYYRPEP